MDISPYLRAPVRELEQIAELLRVEIDESEANCKRLSAEYSREVARYDDAYAKMDTVQTALARRARETAGV
jgi:hypothetical protein